MRKDRWSAGYRPLMSEMEKPLVSVTVDQSLTYVGIGCFHYGLIGVGAILKASESVEIYIISIIDPLLRCAWSISSLQAAMLTVFIFFGMLVGGIIWGSISDLYGRRNTLLLTCISVVIYGVLSSMSPTFSWIVILRMMLAFFLNGLMITTMSYVSEFTPLKYRGKVLVCLFCCWPIGGILITGVAYFSLPVFGWRGLLVSSVLPLIIPAIILYFLPNSPHYLMTVGQESEACSVLDKISRYNRGSPFPFRLTLTGGKEATQIKELWSPKFRTTIICLFILYLGQGIVYVGHILVVVLLPLYKHNCLQNISMFSDSIDMGLDLSCCRPLTGTTFSNIFFASIGEICSIFFTLPFIDLIGRRLTILVNGLLGSIFMLLLSLCVSHVISTLLFVLSRMFLSAFTITLLLYTLEIFPTTVRNFGTGVCQIASFSGSIITPFIAQVMIPKGYGFQAILLYTFVLFFSTVSVCFLPIETKDRALTDTSAENESNFHDIPLLTSNFSLRKSRRRKATHEDFATGASEVDGESYRYGTIGQ